MPLIIVTPTTTTYNAPITLQHPSVTMTTIANNNKKKNNNNMYLVICNISKKNNIKSLLLTAASFGCKEIFVVGQRLFDFQQDLPPILSGHDDMPITRFEKWHQCVEHLKERDILLVGVEIHKDAQNIDQFYCHDQSVAFLMGNEGQGIHEKHLKSCNAFCKISQYGGGTASLNVNVAASIILHRYQLKLMSHHQATKVS